MSTELLILIFVLDILVGVAYTLYARRQATIFSRSIIYSCLVFILIVVSLFAYSRDHLSGTIRYYLDFKHGEFTPTSTFSALVLFSNAFIAFLIAIFSKHRKWWLTIHWLYLVALFVFLSLDEYFSIHEFIFHWENYYISVAALSGIISGFVFWKAYRQKSYFILYFLLYGGMAFSALGGVALEKFAAHECLHLVSYGICQEEPILEEVFEMIGFTTALASLLLLAESFIDVPKWKSLKKWVVAGISAWLFILLFSYWVQPALESKFLATPAEARFADGQMTLTGYRLNTTSIKPGEEFTLLLYWYIGDAPSVEYGYTVNLLHPVTGESVARINTTIINSSTTSWFTGTTHRTALKFQLPEDIETPVSPHVVVTVWRLSGNTYETLTPDKTNLTTFEDMPILRDLSILSSEKPSVTDTERYTFDNGAEIEGYTFSQTDNQIDMSFNWSSTSSAIESNLSQIMHLINENGTDYFIFDRPPFSGAFPTSAWVEGMLETDNWQIEIPDDAPAGDYTLYTGLYNEESGQRIAVSTDNGKQAVNDLIPIAEITVP